jgi:hypothetical protein
MSNRMSSGDQAARLIVRAYIITMAVAALIVTVAILILLQPHSCSAMSRALLVLWATIAALFLASIVVVGVVASSVSPSIRQRWAVVVAYGIVVLASYACIALGLMVAFNC